MDRICTNVSVRACLFIWLTILMVAGIPAVSMAQQPYVELRQETLTSQALTGNLLDNSTERTLYVLLPPGYAASDAHYPVVYVMPWGEGEPTANAWGFKSAMDSLLGKGEIEEMIVVIPDGTNAFGGSLFLSSSILGDYETYLTQDVVNYVDTHYRTHPTRDSRGLAGCSSGGTASMRLGFKYPTVFSVVAATSGEWDWSLEVWPGLVEKVQELTELPKEIRDLNVVTGWWLQVAAAIMPDPNNPPFYGEMPFRIVDGQGEFIPEVFAKLVEVDSAHEARRYLQQPVRLRSILLRHGVNDAFIAMSVPSFVHLLSDLGIKHEYVEEQAGHCGSGWESASLKFMSENLVFSDE